MKQRLRFVSFWLALTGTAVAGEPSLVPSSDSATSLFEAKISPVLAESCVRCHGEKKARGGLRVDSRAAFLKGGDSGPAVAPGDPEKSLLIQALRYRHDEIKMPPDQPLPKAVVEDFATWVKDGVVWTEDRSRRAGDSAPKRHWALEPIAKATPPPDRSGWSAGPIDQFLRAKLQERALAPAATADRRTWIRRLTFDLIGLPPTPEEVQAFLDDSSPEARVYVVERLLASPQYGEHWARHWLDVARYGDTAGFETDAIYRSAWRYRDYVIRSLNADKPFDRFIQEQVAGDELWPGDREAALGTALYCIGPILEESASSPNQLEHEWLTDAVETTGAAFLGLTLGCARCHDHKFDPITQKDFYTLQAVFAASDRPYSTQLRVLRIKALNNLLSEGSLPEKLKNDPRCTLHTEDQVGFHLFHRKEPLEVHRLHRGELGKPREVVGPALPAALPSSPEFNPEPGQRRAVLARWLTAADNPLTARVIVNRVWGWHFGQGLVRTPNDFGRQGEPPTHPELLDWLARDFMEHGWSLKQLHRRILLSSAYQMQSIADACAVEIDPGNRFLAHFPRRRLEGEAIRDSLLACSGTLNGQPFGPAVVPPLSAQELGGLFNPREKWPVTLASAEHTRRSVYLLVRRTFTYPLFAAFDPPEVMSSCPGRMHTVAPTQALTLLNSPLAREQATAFARRLRSECGDNADEIIGRAWSLAFGRPPSPTERSRAVAFLNQRRDVLAEFCLALFNTNEFIYVD